MNRVINPATWQYNFDTVDGPLAQFTGEVALEQLAGNLDFVNEQPAGSYLYHIAPWPEVRRHPRVVSVIFDQCQLGQRNSKGQHVKKPIEWNPRLALRPLPKEMRRHSC